MPTFINIKAAFPKTISWESSGVHTSLSLPVANTILFEHKKRAHHANAKVVVRGSLRGKTIYLHRRHYERCAVNKICRRLPAVSRPRRCLVRQPSGVPGAGMLRLTT